MFAGQGEEVGIGESGNTFGTAQHPREQNAIADLMFIREPLHG